MEDGVLNAHHSVANLVRDLRGLRKRMGLSQQSLAVRLGIALPTVSRWETRRSKPSPLALDKIEVFLHDAGDEGEALLEKYFSNTVRGSR